MDIVLLLKAMLMGIVEGITEFLPVSSTGHLIIVGHLLGFEGEKSNVFEVVIQSGAMLAVVWEYRRRFAGLATGITSDPAAQRFALNLLIALLPAAILGVLLIDYIKTLLFNPVTVAIALIVGGFVMLWADRRQHTISVETVDDMRWNDALKIGCAQIFALIPGVSRSGATIIGGLWFGLSRRAATEFSFFLAVPTLLAASCYDFYRNRALFTTDDIGMFVVGTVSAFISAFICIRWLLRYIATNDFTLFAWYRIGFGCLVLAVGYSGAVTWS